MNVLTGIDLPHPSPGGSVELLRDLYLGRDAPIPADVFMLGTDTGSRIRPSQLALLDVRDKAVSGPAFWTFVDRLADEIRARFAGTEPRVLHFQHLTFGATPALRKAFPDQPSIALVHGTDLLFAESNPTQAEVLRQTVGSTDVIVVPARAMAARLRDFAAVAPERIAHVPWGVPDRLLAEPPERVARASDRLRILYAGRLTSEKATAGVFTRLAEQEDIELSVAAPPAEYDCLAGQNGLPRVRYSGWLAREELWREFARHDLLIVPSLKLEAFGLVAIEAQACGLPVAYQPVPGLTEVLGESALAVDFGDHESVVATMKDLARSPARLDELRSSGLANSARLPLSGTSDALLDLTAAVAR
ncbi:glycosyltransferase family 4 protein [Amycolatopsis sp. NPDC004169]|uniref:glycosyltransferase family 4 protein n=1 Tax=Amycolatopsis sp. NPDC004169 TaxID=3154453 RepID=UPI0033AC65DE